MRALVSWLLLRVPLINWWWRNLDIKQHALHVVNTNHRRK